MIFMVELAPPSWGDIIVSVSVLGGAGAIIFKLGGYKLKVDLMWTWFTKRGLHQKENTFLHYDK
jgi:hypothetical protein